tara:strand:+ start:2390 stop:2860 length:471 start_codon:yes stop_codon:yes gene_type:complete
MTNKNIDRATMGNTLKDLIKNPPVGINNPLLEKLMMEERKKQQTRNLNCAIKYEYPVCFINRDCDQATKQKYELGKQEWAKRNEKGTLANKKYRRAKCWELCAAPPKQQLQELTRQKDIKNLRCSEFSDKRNIIEKLGTGPKIIIGGLILYILLKK